MTPRLVNLKNLSIIILHIFLFAFLFAQPADLIFEHITVDDGLPENTVRVILQDHLGFMWFGTQNGLVKYDGYEMTVYQHDPNDTNSFNSKLIHSMHEDRAGDIWIGTYSEGLFRFNRKTETFTQFKLSQFNFEIYDTLAFLVKKQHTISSILKVSDNEDRVESFEIAEETTVLIVCMGEGTWKKLSDYGWIENEKRNTVWRMDPAKTFWAGGNYKNKIQIAMEIFPPGRYRLRFKSDDSYGYKEWSEGSPGQPEMWGIQLLQINNTTVPKTAFEKQPANTIQSNWVTAIADGQLSNELWITTWGGGLSRLDVSSLLFKYYQHDPNDSNTIPTDYLWDIHQDGKGNIWIASNHGLIRFTPNKEEFTLYRSEFSKNNNKFDKFYTLCEDQFGALWIGDSENGLFKFDRKSETFRHYQHDPNNPNSLSNNLIVSIHEDHQGILWIATEGGGLNAYNREKDNFSRYQHNFKDPHSLSQNLLRSVFEDRTGVLWVGTWTGGLNKMDRGQQRFKRYLHDPNNPNSLSDNEMNTIYEDQSGVIWIGTHSHGLTKYTPQSDQGSGETFRHYQHDPANSNSLSDNQIYSIYEDQQGVLWVGTYDGGLNRFDKGNGVFKHFRHNPNDPHSLGSNRVEAIFEDHIGVLWIGTYYGGLNRYEPETETFTRFRAGKKNQILTIYEDHLGTLWIGTNGDGLLKFDAEKEAFAAYGLDKFQVVTSIYEGKSDNFWIGTYYSGMYLFNRDGGNFTNFSEKQGLINNTIMGILEDDEGKLWISTVKGISKFDYLNRVFKNFTNDDGLLAPYGLAACKSQFTGEMFFGGQKGLTVFHPDSIKDNLYPPQIAITDFRLFNEPVEVGADSPLKEAISITPEIRLSHWQNDISFGFAALHFNNPQKNEYAYFLFFYDDDWRYVGNQRVASYTNLDPGEYTFRVKASNNDGVWNEEGTSLRIIITPPWWKTWWAYSIYIALILGTLYGLRRYELSRQRFKHQMELEHVEAEKLQELDRMKSRFFANISHEFRTPLTLISGPVQQLLSGKYGKFREDVKEQYDLILRNTRRLLRLVNQLLDISRLESGKMKLQARPENIVELSRQLTMAFESLASVNEIELRFTGPEEPVMVYLEREHYEKIITNLLFNALKFTPEGGQVIVHIPPASPAGRPSKGVIEGGMLEIRITDTGPGIPADHLSHIFDRFYQAGDSYAKDPRGSGIGLALTKELVELHHGEIIVESEFGKGTEFTIRLPLGKEHLLPEEIVDETIDVNAEITPFNPPLTRGEERGDDTIPVDATEESSKDKPTPILLIVEDNPDMRTYIRDMLVDIYKIIEAADGQEGFEKAAEITPDIIISDVMMPEMDGFQFCEKIKTDERTSHIPVILLTAKSSGESKVEGLETGADDYLIKPFDSTELKVRVRNLIEQRCKLRERFKQEITLEPKEIAITSADAHFLQRVMDAIERHLEETEFGVAELSDEVGMSRSQLFRKLKALTDQTPLEFIRTIKLKRGAALLEQHSGNISEIAYQVGFNNPAYFSQAFRKLFGVSPKDYVSQTKN